MGFIDWMCFDLMKESVIFVNILRVVVVNCEDFLFVLKEYKIRGVILDVFYYEFLEKLDYEFILLFNVLVILYFVGVIFEVEDYYVMILNKVFKRWKVEKIFNILILYNKDELKIEV